VKVITLRDRDEWLHERRKHIGASDAPVILGHGYASQSPFTVFQSKMGHDLAPTEAEAKRFERGHICEKFALQLFTLETGIEVETEDNVICVSDEDPWMAASRDGVVVGSGAPVEAKMVSSWMRREWLEGGKEVIPLNHHIQLQHQMFVTEKDHGWLVGVADGTPMIREVPRNDRFIAAMREKLRRFWDCVLEGREPEIDSSAATKRMIKALYPDDLGGVAPLPADVACFGQAREELLAMKKEIGEAIDFCENRLLAAIGDSTYGYGPDGRIVYSWKKEYHAASVRKASSRRVLRICKRGLPPTLAPPIFEPNTKRPKFTFSPRN